MGKLLIKDILEWIIALCLILFLSPLFVIVYMCLWYTIKCDPIFVQERIGINEVRFRIFKFKSMLDTKDKNGLLLPDDQRLTSIGKVIRKTSLDELPQLFNILKGDMSFIGPRPLLVEYLPLYNEHQQRRHIVKPGITGWAQVNGRNAISWEDKFNLDVWYVDNFSFTLDIKILFLTILKVLKRDGVSSTDSTTMTKFKGSK